MEKHFKTEMKEKRKMVKEFTDKKKKIGKGILEKINDIRDKGNQLEGLLKKMKGFEMGEDIINKWNEENRKLFEKLDNDEKTALDVDAYEAKPKATIPPKARKAKDNFVASRSKEKSPPKVPVSEKKIENKPPIRPKPFGNMKKGTAASKPSLNTSKQSIEEEIPKADNIDSIKEEVNEDVKEEIAEEPIVEETKPAAKPNIGNKPSFAKPSFGSKNTKSKPNFMSKPFGKPSTNPTALNDSKSSVKLNESKLSNPTEKKEQPSFTEKYGLANNNTSSISNTANKNPPWMQSNQNSIPEAKNETNFGNYNQPRKFQVQKDSGMNNDIPQIPTIGDNKQDIDKINAIPTIGDSHRSNRSNKFGCRGMVN
jgi:hypothetical protein